MIHDAHAKAFSVAAAMPAQALEEAQTLIDPLLERGASFHEAKTALQPLIAQILAVPKESA